jgi:hypothetical protein
MRPVSVGDALAVASRAAASSRVGLFLFMYLSELGEFYKHLAPMDFFTSFEFLSELEF